MKPLFASQAASAPRLSPALLLVALIAASGLVSAVAANRFHPNGLPVIDGEAGLTGRDVGSSSGSSSDDAPALEAPAVAAPAAGPPAPFAGLPSTGLPFLSISVGPGGTATLVTVTLPATAASAATTTAGLLNANPSATGASFSQVIPAPLTTLVPVASVNPNTAPASGIFVGGGILGSTVLGSGATAVAASAPISTAESDNSDNGEKAGLSGVAGLSTQEVAGIMAGLVVVVVVLVSVGCFTAENMYKKRQRHYQAARRIELMKSTMPLGPRSKPLI